jgi:hypothetical protein
MNWTHIETALPDFGVPVLLTDGRSILVGERGKDAWRGEGKPQWDWRACGVSGYEWEWDFDDDELVTHWMSLPALPGKATECQTDEAEMDTSVEMCIAAIPAGTTVTPQALDRLYAAYLALARPLTAEEARGVIQDRVLNVATVAPGAEFTVTVGEAGEGRRPTTETDTP